MEVKPKLKPNEFTRETVAYQLNAKCFDKLVIETIIRRTIKGDSDINCIESSPKRSVGTGYKSVSYYRYISGTITQSDDYGLLR